MKIHIITIKKSQSYGITSAWEPNGTKFLTRAPMFGKTLPLSNNTSSRNKKVLCH